MKYKSIRGVKDILPGEIERIQRIEKVSREMFEAFGYSEIRIPIFEATEVFGRGIGSTTDIVEKEMYTFPDRDGTSLSLRPEGTASVVRAFIEHHLNQKAPITKLYYMGPMFRYERPQAGRFRQFYQVGIEAFGSASPLVDVEMLSLAAYLLEALGVPGSRLEINSLGDSACRPAFRESLKNYFSNNLDRLCEDCRRRFETNPLRILDCKNEGCRTIAADAPSSLRHLCADCAAHFEEVARGLGVLGIPFVINEHLVRGLDYYTRTAFEVTATGLGAQNAVLAGGRYDGLVEELGGPATPGIGFAMGIERIASLMKAVDPARPDVFFALLGTESRKELIPVVMDLRKKGLRVEMDYADTPLKKQMALSDRIGARFTLIVGENELKSGKAILRNMTTKEQEDPPIASLRQILRHLVSS